MLLVFCTLRPPPVCPPIRFIYCQLVLCQNICTNKQKINKTCSIKYNLIYYRYKNVIQKELIQSVNTIKFSHPSLIFLSCLPSKTIIASFVVIGKIDSSHPNHNSILKSSWKSYPGGSDHTIRRIMDVYLLCLTDILIGSKQR